MSHLHSVLRSRYAEKRGCEVLLQYLYPCRYTLGTRQEHVRNTQAEKRGCEVLLQYLYPCRYTLGTRQEHVRNTLGTHKLRNVGAMSCCIFFPCIAVEKRENRYAEKKKRGGFPAYLLKKEGGHSIRHPTIFFQFFFIFSIYLLEKKGGHSIRHARPDAQALQVCHKCQKRPTIASKETYYMRTFESYLWRRPTVSKETYYSVKRDLLYADF